MKILLNLPTGMKILGCGTPYTPCEPLYAHYHFILQRWRLMLAVSVQKLCECNQSHMQFGLSMCGHFQMTIEMEYLENRHNVVSTKKNLPTFDIEIYPNSRNFSVSLVFTHLSCAFIFCLASCTCLLLLTILWFLRVSLGHFLSKGGCLTMGDYPPPGGYMVIYGTFS